MVARKPAYLMAGMAVLVIVVAVLGTFRGNARVDTDSNVPTVVQSVFLSSSMSTSGPVIFNQYGWYTDGASNTNPDKDSREH